MGISRAVLACVQNSARKGQTLLGRILRLLWPAPKQAASHPELFGIRGGVFIRQPNGSSHPIQNLLEQALVRNGMALFDLRVDPALKLLEKNEWDDMIAQSLLDVAIVGHIIVRQVEGEQVEYVTVRHVDTETGRRFDALPMAHPDYRALNSSFNDHRSYYEVFGWNWYFEPEEEYQRRREIEREVYLVKQNQLSIDVRFYGRSGEIHGGHVGWVPAGEDAAERMLVDGVVASLLETAEQSLRAHRTSLAEQELMR